MVRFDKGQRQQTTSFYCQELIEGEEQRWSNTHIQNVEDTRILRAKSVCYLEVVHLRLGRYRKERHV